MRNIFDQYTQPENRLTHALVSSLEADSKLFRRFIYWITGKTAPFYRTLKIAEQHLPDEGEAHDEKTDERRGLPDAWIYNDSGWALLIESKIESPLRRDQLERHRRTAERQAFTDIQLLALVMERPSRFGLDEVKIRTWAELYSWFLKEKRSEWARRLINYFEILETKLVDEKYLKEGTLTMFAGIRFDRDSPYEYHEAKRLLRLAMDKLQRRNDLKRELGMDPKGKRRPAITGREGRSVWDFLPLAQAKGAKNFTEFPHLTLGIQEERLLVIVTVPNGIRREFRRNLIEGGKEKFINVFRSVNDNLCKTLSAIDGATPWIEVVQRHYPSQRAAPIIDARLEFDLRTAGFSSPKKWRRLVKQQPQWLDAAYEALSSRKHSNLQLAIGAAFPYERCSAVHRLGILDHVAAVWLACKPLIRAMVR